MNREIIPGRWKRCDGVLYKMQPLLTPWLSASMMLAVQRELKQIDLAGHWLVQHTAPVRAKPDNKRRLEGARYKYTTSCSLPTNPPSSHVTHTLAHTYQFPSSPWAMALDHYIVLGWTSARNKKRNEKDPQKLYWNGWPSSSSM